MNVDNNSYHIVRQSKYYLLTKFFINSQIPALMIKPTTPPPYPAIFFLHYYRGNKENIQFLANDLGKSGFMAVAIDMEYHGDRAQTGKDILSPDIENDKKAFYRTIKDSLTALRFIENHPDFDCHSLFFWGVSLGALIGSIVCAQYGKFKGISLVVGGGNIEILARESMLDSMVNIRYTLLKKKISPLGLAQRWKDIDPLYWISHLDQVPVYFFNASQDIIVPPECTWALFERTPSPKKIFWFPTGHGLLFERYFGVPRKIIGLFSQLTNKK